MLQGFVDAGGDITAVDLGIGFAYVHAHSLKIWGIVHSLPCSTSSDFLEYVGLLSLPSLLLTSIS
jgi:hypothetical protein